MKTINGSVLKIENNQVKAWDAAAAIWRTITLYSVNDVDAAEEASEELLDRLHVWR